MHGLPHPLIDGTFDDVVSIHLVVVVQLVGLQDLVGLHNHADTVLAAIIYSALFMMAVINEFLKSRCNC